MPLTFRDKGASKGMHFEAVSGELCIGYVGREVLSSTARCEQLWRWTLYIGSAAPPGLERHGHASSCDEAKTTLEQNWQRWLKAAGLSEA
jgi:hypothetical protein